MAQTSVRAALFILTILASIVKAGPLFLVDDTSIPRVSLAWTTANGEKVELEADRDYRAPAEHTPLGRNVRCFVAAGGTRLDKQGGHPDGAIVRVGFYKEDREAWFFEGIAPGSEVTIVLENVRFNRTGHPNVPSILQHNKYLLSDLEACGLTGDAMDQYNTWSPTDDMNGKLPPEKSRMGVLGGRKPRATVTQDETGACRLVARIPYGWFRHLQDPWTLETPGSFFEPEHFHVEFEALPEEVWNKDLHGATPRP